MVGQIKLYPRPQEEELVCILYDTYKSLLQPNNYVLGGKLVYDANLTRNR